MRGMVGGNGCARLQSPRRFPARDTGYRGRRPDFAARILPLFFAEESGKSIISIVRNFVMFGLDSPGPSLGGV